MAYASPTRDRIPALIGAVTLQGALLAALVAGLAFSRAAPVQESLETFSVVTPPPPPPRPRPTPPPERNTRPEGEAAPPALRAQATEVVAPKPIVVVPPPPPQLVVAPRAGEGAAPRQGAAEVPGPGTGAGGVGDGTGAGGSGDGDGGGWDETPPRWRRGELRDSDYPLSEGEAGVGGTVSVRYLVGVDGRVGDCRITRSSGSPLLDSTTCRLIRQRFRFEPSRDGRGRPVPAWLVENHSWTIEIDERPDR